MDKAHVQGPPRFRGSNPDDDDISSLPFDEYAEIMGGLQERNLAWLKWKAEELGAGWLAVVDGQVIRWGKGREDLPPEAEAHELSRSLGKCPIWFMHPRITEIEEGSAWSAVVGGDEPYPTVPVNLSGCGARWDVVADLDTGSPMCFVSEEELASRGLVVQHPRDQVFVAVHLGAVYRYAFKPLEISLATARPAQPHVTHAVGAVRKWAVSPFVRINPKREALMGRDALAKLSARLLLDFGEHRTEIA